MDIHKAVTWCDPKLVAEVRARLLPEMTAHPDLYDKEDVERIRTDDWMVKRYILAQHSNADKAFEMAKEAMKWRKEFGVNQLTDLDFPAEMYKVGALFVYKPDSHGLPVFYLRVKYCKSLDPKFNELVRKFLVHLANKLDKQYGEIGGATVWDLQGAGVSNCDLSLLSFLIKTFFTYFPHPKLYAIAWGIHWILKPVVKLAVKLLPEDERRRVVIPDKKELFELIPPLHLPDFIEGGLCLDDYRAVPKGALDINELLPTKGFTKKECDKYYKEYQEYLK